MGGVMSDVMSEARITDAVGDIAQALAALPVAAAEAAPAALRRAAPRARPRAPRSETRIGDEAAFVLHSYPYKETSLIVDALTRHHGRVSLVARGAKRPRSALRGVLLAFSPLTISWVQARSRAATNALASAHGGSDLRTLTRAEWIGGLRPLRGDALMAGFYLNELIQKLLARDDPHEAVFDAYHDALAALADDGPVAPVLRHFEGVLLREAGYALRLVQTASGESVEATAFYRYVPEQGPIRVESADARSRVDDDDATVLGRTLLDIEADDFSDPVTLAQAKTLMRFLLHHHMPGQVLHTRRMMLDLQSLEEGTRR